MDRRLNSVPLLTGPCVPFAAIVVSSRQLLSNRFHCRNRLISRAALSFCSCRSWISPIRSASVSRCGRRGVGVLVLDTTLWAAAAAGGVTLRCGVVVICWWCCCSSCCCERSAPFRSMVGTPFVRGVVAAAAALGLLATDCSCGGGGDVTGMVLFRTSGSSSSISMVIGSFCRSV